MKIKPYIQFVNESNIKGTSPIDNIEMLLNTYNIIDYTINEDLTVDVDGPVYLYKKNLNKIPLNFNCVKGDVNFASNNLTSLIGSPKIVDDNFDVMINKLTTLEYSPEKIGEFFGCNNNELTTLKGCPKYIGKYIDCSNNKLTNLEYFPEYVGDIFYANDNPLTSLYGLPETFKLDYLSIEDTKNHLIGEFIEKNLDKDESLIQYYLEGIKNHIDNIPDSIQDKYGYLLEFEHYTKLLK